MKQFLKKFDDYEKVEGYEVAVNELSGEQPTISTKEKAPAVYGLKFIQNIEKIYQKTLKAVEEQENELTEMSSV